jgi:hypothetical protein
MWEVGKKSREREQYRYPNGIGKQTEEVSVKGGGKSAGGCQS